MRNFPAAGMMTKDHRTKCLYYLIIVLCYRTALFIIEKPQNFPDDPVNIFMYVCMHAHICICICTHIIKKMINTVNKL